MTIHKAPHAANSETLKILIVDDEEDLLELLAQHFESRGHVTAPCTNIQQARQQLEQEAFDLILCDMRMPGGGAHDLLPHRDSFLGNPHFIVMTGFSAAEDEQTLTSLGAQVLEKPFECSSLGPLLESLGARKSPSP